MSQIISGVSPAVLVIESIPNAARVTWYNSAGTELCPPVTGSYLTKIETRCTGAPAAGVTIWNLKGSTTKKLYIRRISGTVCFDGTALAASGTLRFGFYRGAGTTSAIVPTGGTVQQITAKDNSLPISSVTDIRSDGNGVGLTTTNITYEADAFHVVSLPVVSLQVSAPATSASIGAVANFDVNFHNDLEPASDYVITGATLFEHLAIRVQTVAGIIGFGINGSVQWDER